MVVESDATDPGGIRITLRATTAYEGREHDAVLDPVVLEPGGRVTVWYRSFCARITAPPWLLCRFST
jgi:hypothetical protein